jgi:hypothetical protein
MARRDLIWIKPIYILGRNIFADGPAAFPLIQRKAETLQAAARLNGKRLRHPPLPRGQR